MTMTATMAAEGAALGPERGRSEAGATHVLRKVTGAVFLGALGGVLLWASAEAPVRGPGMVALLVGLGALMLVGAVASLVTAVVDRGMAVVLHERGFLYRRSGRTRSVFWAEVREFYSDVRVFTDQRGNSYAAHNYTVVTADGTRLVLNDSLPDVERLAGFLEDRMVQHLMPQYQERLERVGRVRIGEWELSRDGLAYNGKTLSWSQVQSFDVQNGVLLVRSVGGRLAWATVPAGKLANAGLLLGLGRRLRESALRS